jgi:hypothetical protein
MDSFFLAAEYRSKNVFTVDLIVTGSKGSKVGSFQEFESSFKSLMQEVVMADILKGVEMHDGCVSGLKQAVGLSLEPENMPLLYLFPSIKARPLH